MTRKLISSRRQLLKTALALSGSALSTASWRTASAALKSSLAPKYIVVIFPAGGLDSLLSTDAKTPGQLESWVHQSYGPSDIVQQGPFSFAQPFAPLAKHAELISLVKGVRLYTANHNTGHAQLIRFRTRTHRQMPSLLDIIGQSRTTQATRSITLGAFGGEDFSSGFFGTPLVTSFTTPQAKGRENIFSKIDRLSSTDLKMLASVTDEKAQALRQSWRAPLRPEQLQTVENLQEASSFYKGVSNASKFKPQSWTKDWFIQSMADPLQRAKWLIENDLTRCVLVQVHAAWDTHYENDRKQKYLNAGLSHIVSRFLETLKAPRKGQRPLIEDTLVVLGSEIGRFPRLNTLLGKDHFPQADFLFAGKGVVAGRSFGGTDKRMVALPVDLRGQPDQKGRELRLDDLGTTLLSLCGYDPELFGYSGRVLNFLTGSAA